MPRTETIDEVGELVTTLFATPAQRLTACRGWTAHELVAHLAAGASEEADVIDAHLAGVPRPTRGFEEREAPFRALDDTALRDRLVEEAARLEGSIAALSERGREPAVFTGRPMSPADFAMHSRSECSLHRWDLVGRDDVGWAMLGQPSLTRHAVGVLTSMSTLPEAPANRYPTRAGTAPLRAIIRSGSDDDLIVTAGAGQFALDLRPASDAPPDVEVDAAARLLLLWGRREPSAPVDVHATGEVAAMLAALFGW